MVQWLRICLPVQRTQVQSLVWEDPTYHGATEPVSHHLLKHAHPEPMLHKERSHHNEKPTHRKEVPEQPKINK